MTDMNDCTGTRLVLHNALMPIFSQACLVAEPVPLSSEELSLKNAAILVVKSSAVIVKGDSAIDFGKGSVKEE
jgi:hypothetical protein